MPYFLGGVMGYIYKITNKKTGKMYVGQTANTIQSRWLEHLSKAKNPKENYLLYQVMRRSGVENFIIEEIEKCPNNKLDEREKYWIKELGTFGNGYNMTAGGDSFRKYALSQKEEEQLWEDFCNGISITELAKITGYSKTFISSRLSKHKNYKRICKRNIEGKTKPYSQLRKYKRIIYVYDMEGNPIEKTKLSCFEMSERDEIIACAKGKKKSFKSKLYSYALLSNEDMTNMYDRFRKRKLYGKPIYDLITLYKIRTLNKSEKREH